jgi:uncharacterized protein
MRLIARNLDTGSIVADRVSIATSRLDRAVGLIRRSRLEPGEGLLIAPCRGVHTCWMRFAIDLVALDASGRVVDAVTALRPWRVRLPRRGAVKVLELPAGSLARSNTREGQRITLEPAFAGAQS